MSRVVFSAVGADSFGNGVLLGFSGQEWRNAMNTCDELRRRGIAR